MPAERPLLILPTPAEPMPRAKLGGGPGRLRLPDRGRQAARLDPAFAALRQAFEERRVSLQAEAAGVVPEQVLVIQTIGSPQGFLTAVRHVRGLEWLAEIDLEDLPADEDFYLAGAGGQRTDDTLDGKLLVVFSDQQALAQLESLWKRWKEGEAKLGKNFEAWKAVFRQTRVLRRWGIEDRLEETGVLDDWRQRVAFGQESVRCEVELWYRSDAERRAAAQERVRALVAQENGRVLHGATIADIGYDALLVELSSTAIRPLVDGSGDVALVRCEDVQFLRATGQAAVEPMAGDRERDEGAAEAEEPVGEPIVALLDGLPLQSHRRLAGRLKLDDPDGFEAGYQAAERRHGTAMASLILHGDLSSPGPPLRRPLYVRPILKPDPRDTRPVRDEQAPVDQLFIDLVHRSVRRLFEAEAEQPAAAPGVRVISFSIGIKNRPFLRELSPLARLLDWLAQKYQVLFIVSAGNHLEPLRLGAPREDVLAGRVAAQALTLRSLAQDARNRRLLSPAEAVNVLTIGSAHEDSLGVVARPRAVEAVTLATLPSPLSALGLGYRRSVKPDILMPGGRVLLLEDLRRPASEGWFELDRSTARPGQRVAAPGAQAGDLDFAWYSRGTSNAAALASRSAAQLADVLEELRTQPGGYLLDQIPWSLFLRTLLVHGAGWGPARQALEVLRDMTGNDRFAEYVSRFIGHGYCDPARVMECTTRRVTALSGGTLAANEARVHRFPLPRSLDGRAGWRRFVVTLSWFSPVRQRPLGSWTKADLWVGIPTLESQLGVSRDDVDTYTGRRGTVQHQVFSGRAAGVFDDDGLIEAKVSCRAEDGKKLASPVPYGLALTLEVAPDLAIDVYAEVRARVRATLEVRP